MFSKLYYYKASKRSQTHIDSGKPLQYTLFFRCIQFICWEFLAPFLLLCVRYSLTCAVRMAELTVSKIPGDTELTRISGPDILASVSKRCSSAAFVTEYA
jgi:hypothetical protein